MTNVYVHKPLFLYFLGCEQWMDPGNQYQPSSAICSLFRFSYYFPCLFGVGQFFTSPGTEAHVPRHLKIKPILPVTLWFELTIGARKYANFLLGLGYFSICFKKITFISFHSLMCWRPCSFYICKHTLSIRLISIVSKPIKIVVVVVVIIAVVFVQKR